MITGKTKICAIIGDPVGHSMSPAMHNAAFKKLELDYLYVPFLVKPEQLPEAVKGMRALNIVGFNVTIPHKVAVIPLLDDLEPLAKKIGAVNTVVNRGGKLIGYNTDATGFLRVLLECNISPHGEKITILGAGGASRAISYILAEKGARLTILNRQEGLSHARSIADSIYADLGQKIKVLELGRLAEGLQNIDILINATSVGMRPHIENNLVPVNLLKKIPLLIDIVYNPVETGLLKEAKAAGAKTINGLDMLVWQGALAFEKWTGEKAPLELMKSEAEKMLVKDEN